MVSINDNNESVLAPFFGTYRGFSPTDESPIAAGELEITITQDSVNWKMATGLKIEEASIDSELFNLKPNVPKGVLPTIMNYVVKPKILTEKGIYYVFTTGVSFGMPRLQVLGTMGDFIGPTLLYSPRQMETGAFDKFLANLHKKHGDNCFPMLQYNGRTKPKLSTNNEYSVQLKA